MLHSLDELVSVLDRLMIRMDELESRLAAFESQAPVRVQPSPQETRGSAIAVGPDTVPSVSLQAAAAAPALASHPIEQILSRPGESAAPVVGKVFSVLPVLMFCARWSSGELFPSW